MCAEEGLWRRTKSVKTRADLEHWTQALLRKAAALNRAPPAAAPRRRDREPAPVQEERTRA